jgi:hypothetical protein
MGYQDNACCVVIARSLFGRSNLGVSGGDCFA